MNTKELGLQKIKELVIRFNEQIIAYKKSDYNETQTRRDFIDPFFKALGWDIDNEQGFAESYREVIHEDRVKVGKATKAPDYSFRIGGGNRLFFVEAKKPSVFIKDDMQPAYQVRRYSWSAKLSVSIITDFEEFAIYDCTKKPNPNDKSSTARIKYLTFQDYEKEWDFLWNTFSKEAVLKGNFDKFIKGNASKKGTVTVDKEFLLSLDQLRTLLAETISKENKQLDEDELNFVVQQTLDRIIFLRICEDRAIENYGNLQNATKSGEYYQNFLQIFKDADDKYNSGLFNFKKDKLSQQLKINNKTLKSIATQLYYPESPYEFSVLDVEILGSAYEQFLGKTITINSRGRAVIELKPEVRKAGGVYYTPQYIVDYIVQNTIGNLTMGLSPLDVAKIKIVDPACGSGSFLLGAYQFLLNWHIDYYTKNPEEAKKQKAFTPLGALSTAIKKQILLNNIYGVDIDTNAVEVTKLSLLLKCLEGETQASIAHQMSMFKERVLPTLDDNIKSGNSLIDTDYYDNQLDFGEERKIKPFNWQKAFPEVFNREIKTEKEDLKSIASKAKEHAKKAMDYATQLEEKLNYVNEPNTIYGKKYNGGFDVVIGNPPYVSIRNLTENVPVNVKNYFTSNYKTAFKGYDLYVLFFELGLKILNANGILSYITPNKFTTLDYGLKIRELILKSHTIIKLIDVSNLNVFENASVYPYISIIEKRENIDYGIEIRKCNKIEDLINSNYSLINQSFFLNQNNFNISLNTNINSNSNSIKLLTEVCKVQAGTTGFLATKTKECISDGGDGLDFIVTGSIDRYFINIGDVRYINKRFKLPRINNDKNIITKGKWDLFCNKKIVIGGMTKSIEASIDLVGLAVGVGVYCLNDFKINEYYLLGLLNSKYITYFFRSEFEAKHLAGGYLAINAGQLEQIPIKTIDFSNEQETHSHNQIVTHVEQLLQLHKDLQEATLESKKEQIQAKIDYHEDKINVLVYALYELTEEEIKIIEN
jgi:hypothetical protein